MSLSSPMLTAALQNATLGAFANVLAQLITAYRTEVRMRTHGAQTETLLLSHLGKKTEANKSFKSDVAIDWIPVFQFLLFNLICTPPNFMWQDFLETTFPAHPKPKPPKEKNTKPKLSVRNTAIKFLLDQTVGAALNTLLFSTYVHSFRLALHPVPVITSIPKTVVFLTSPGALNFSRVDWPTVWAAAQEEFVPFVVAGWKLWPAVSLVNFAAIKTVEGRNLVGALAGVAWGVYVSLVSAQ